MAVVQALTLATVLGYRVTRQSRESRPNVESHAA